MILGEIRDIAFRISQRGNQMFRISIMTDSEIQDQKWINEYLTSSTPLPLIDRWWELIGICPTGEAKGGISYSWLQFATTQSFDLIGVKVKMDLIQEDGWDGWKVKTVVAQTDVPQETTEPISETVPKDDDIPF